MDPAIRPVWKGAALCGIAFPVLCQVGDNLAIHRALERCQPNDVLVVGASGDDSGYFGQVLATAAQARGVTGLVIDGGVRDITALESIGFPVFARSVSMRRTVKQKPGLIGNSLVIAGVSVSRESMIVADSDGVVVVDAKTFEAILCDAEARATKEADLMAKLRLGELTLDLLGIRPHSE
jgi:4-hydroxy-4-methyl-2-oxoglutarate aldolase